MLSLEHFLLGAGIMMFVSGTVVLGYDVCARVDSEKESGAFVSVESSTGLGGIPSRSPCLLGRHC